MLGRFSKSGKEYIINTPNMPRLWNNYLSNSQYGLHLAQNGEGHSVYSPPDGSKLTVADKGSGRYFYIRDNRSGQYWSATAGPVYGALDEFSCIHGLGFTEFRARKGMTSSSVTVYIPLEGALECWKLILTNHSDKSFNISVFTCIEWCLGGYMQLWDNPVWYTKTEYRVEEAAIVATFRDPLFHPAQHRGIIIGSAKPGGYDCRKADFIGKEMDYKSPQAVVKGRCTSKEAKGCASVGVLKYDLRLKPGEAKRMNFIIGHSKDVEKEIEVFKGFLHNAKWDKEFDRVKEFWENTAKKTMVETPDKKINHMVNYWLKYQIYQCATWCRGGDLVGYRDAMQDVMSLAMFLPEEARRKFLQALSFQYKSGFAPRQFALAGGPHDTRPYSDSPVWIIYALTSYLKETGELSILDKVVPYLDGGEDIVFKHARKALDYLWKRRGSHGLSLMAGGDWNDALDGVGKEGKGESIWLSMALRWALLQMEELCRYLGKKKLANVYQEKWKELKDNINRYAWDGNWYIRAISDDGALIGSKKNKEGKIYLNPQSWAIISGVADEEKKKKIIRSIARHLDTPLGPLTMAPAYTKYDPTVGRISVLYPGMFENSAIYCHAAAFLILAELMDGKGDTAYEIYKKIEPDSKPNPATHSTAEPYVFTNCYFGPNSGDLYGISLSSWMTGACDWIYKALVENMMGVKAGYHGLILNPVLPSLWKKVKIYRKLRNANYDIEICRGDEPDKLTIKVDGDIVNSNIIPYFNDDRIHKIRVEL